MKIAKISSLILFLFSFKAFSENINQVLVEAPEFGTKKFAYEEIDGHAITEGDIILGKIDQLREKGALVHRYLNRRWPNAILPYKINGEMPIKNRIYIYQAMDEIATKTNVRFVAITCENADQYQDYVEFMPSVSTCSSYVGRLGGRQGISLAPGCYKGGSIHEIMHALGFWHEQSRSDRDSYVRIVWDNIRDSAKGNFNIQETNGFRMGGYDYRSIMHYGPRAFSKNGRDTIVPLEPDTVIGQREGMSPIDVQTMNRIYPDSSSLYPKM